MKNVIIAIVVLAVVGGGTYFLIFSGSSNGTPSVTSTSIATPTQPAPSQTPEPSVSNAAVDIKNFAFTPATLTVKVGTTVTWTNNDTAPHTITSDTDGVLNSTTLSKGQSFSFTFTKVGTTKYHCGLHSIMKAEVVVASHD